MSILTWGVATGEVETMLRLAAPVNPNDPDPTRARQSRMIVGVLDAIEAHVRSVTGRRFEATAYADAPIDVEPGRRHIVLPDRPVRSWTSIKQVLARDDQGLPADACTFPQSAYAVYAAEGRLTLLDGCWPAGPQALLVTCELGYAPAEIAAAVDDDVRSLKNLVAAVLAREYKRFLEGVHHVNSMTFGDQTTSFRAFLLPLEEIQLLNLRREIL